MQAMRKFFETTKLTTLKCDARWFQNIETLGWTSVQVNHMYWRSCYSYLLCSIVGGLEMAYNQWKEPQGVTSRTQQFALTGTQGTGKSVFGSFLGLVLSEAYGWRVEYHYGQTSYSFGQAESTKIVMIWDGSEAKKSDLPPAGAGVFQVLVTSFNTHVWHNVAQQNSWTMVDGNYLFIDTVPKAEMADMAQGKHDDWMENFKIAGGVPRICFASQSTKDLIDSACDSFLKLPKLAKVLESLNTSDGETTTGEKIYPGLVAHFMPSMPYRESCHFGIASPHVLAKLHAEVAAAEEGEIHALLRDLLQMKKARSFAGWIWEPLFAKKLSKKQDITFVGCKLPATNEGAEVLLEEKIDKFFLYNDNADLSTILKEFMASTTLNVAIGKAKNDNNTAIDGVLIRRDPFRLTGLQLCVSQASHPVQAKGVIELQKLGSDLANIVRQTSLVELWFLQPEECLLSDFCFVSRQALEFTNAQSNRKEPTAKKLKSSNNPDVWPEAVVQVVQRVVVPVFKKAAQADTPHADIVAKLSSAVSQARGKSGETAEVGREPRLRTRVWTVKVARLLSKKFSEVFPTLIEDLSKDGIDAKPDTGESIGMDIDSEVA